MTQQGLARLEDLNGGKVTVNEADDDSGNPLGTGGALELQGTSVTGKTLSLNGAGVKDDQGNWGGALRGYIWGGLKMLE